MIPRPRLVQPRRRQVIAQGEVTPQPLVFFNALDLNGNGDGNAGWSNGDRVNTTTRRPVNLGTLGGDFFQSASAPATGWRYVANGGDGIPTMQSSTTNSLATLVSSLPASAFVDLGPSGGPFGVYVVVAILTAGAYQDALVCNTQLNGVGGQGMQLGMPSDGGFPFFGIFGNRGPETTIALDPDPVPIYQPAGARGFVAYEHPGGSGTGTQRIWVNDVEGTPGAVGTFTPASSPGETFRIGGSGSATGRPLRGNIRWLQAYNQIGLSSSLFNQVVAEGLITV